MSETPTFSVVLPTLNRQAYLPQAIDSVLKQTRADLELIIVDNHSTDATPQIIADYAARDGRVVATLFDKAQGALPGALNHGISLARGRFFTWLGDDDRLHLHALETLHAALEAHPQAGLVFANHDEIDGAGGFVKHGVHLPLRYITQKNVVSPSFLVRMELLRAVGGFRVPTFMAEDYNLWLRLLDETRFVQIGDFLYEFRRHRHHLTSSAGRLAIDQAALRAIADALESCRWLAQGQARGELAWQAYELAARHHLPDAARYQRTAWQHAPLYALRRTLKAAIPKPIRERLGRRDGGYL
jgi:glycosyltransferase involved in cell wall biosynthesis